MARIATEIDGQRRTAKTLKPSKISYFWRCTELYGGVSGADNRSRTYDLRITNALLYQLSYIGIEPGLRSKPEVR